METPVVDSPASVLDTTKANADIYTALAQAQADVESVGKDGKNTQRGYKYATTEAMIRGSRQHLAAHGLAFFSTWAQSLPEVAEGNIGQQHVAARVTIHWVLGHASGGQITGTAHMDAIGSPARPPDKAVAAAVTYGLGFVLRGLLLLDRCEEDEHSPDKRQEPEPDRLWMAYEAKRDALAKARKLTTEQAHTTIREAAGVTHNGTETDEEVERMIAAAGRMLEPPPREPITPGDNRERAAVKGEQQAEPAKPRATKGKGKAAPKAEGEPELTPEQQEARAALQAARASMTSAARAYVEEAKAQGVTPKPWKELAGRGIGREWLEDEPHTVDEWIQAAGAFEAEIEHLRRAA